MSTFGLKIYLSIDPSEPLSLRQSAEDCLLKFGAIPVSSPSITSQNQSLQSILQDCRAFVHVAVAHSTSDPLNHYQPISYDQGGRTPTQREYEVALELQMEIYLFVCSQPFDSTPATPPTVVPPHILAPPHDPHRQRIITGDHSYREIHSAEELLIHLRPLAISTKNLHTSFHRRPLPTSLTLFLPLALLISSLLVAYRTLPTFPHLKKISPLHTPVQPPPSLNPASSE
ncbi:MAG: hypothetical protein WCI46_04365 [Verrucomicrobiota bacterium]